MKKLIKLSVLVLLLSFLFGSCSIEKRVYNKGYHIEWKKQKHSSAKENVCQDGIQKSGEKNDPNGQINNIELAIEDNTSESNELNLIIEQVPNSGQLVQFVPVRNKNFNKVINLTDNFSNREIEKVDSKFSNKSNFFKSSKQNRSSSGGGKSQLVALLLCIFFGVIGIHRFYLGYIGIGIIQLLTAGGCGIWALIDLIMIITGDLKPKNGDYDKTL